MNLKSIATLFVIVATSFAVAQPAHDHDHGHDHDHDKKDEHAGHVDEVKLTPEAIARYGIKTGKVSKHPLARMLSVPARVAFDAEAIAHVGSAVSGRAVEIKARVGQDVKKNDELIVIESPELGEAQSDFLQKRTALAVAKSAVEPVRDAGIRARRLHDQNQGIALAEVQKREAEARAAEGAVHTAQASLTAAESKLSMLGMDRASIDTLAGTSKINARFAIRAPIDGQVIEREVTLGELVSPEKESLLIIANMDALWVIADVTESRLPDVKVGSDASVRVRANGSEPVAGKVSFISPTLDPETRAAQVRIEVANKDRKLKPGMFATADITPKLAWDDEDTLAVPNEAVQTVEGAAAVFVPVKGEPNTFAKRAIKVGPAVGALVPVLSGLKEEEEIVISGTFILKAELGKSGAAHEH